MSSKTTMRALLVETLGMPMQIRSVQIPEIGQGQCLIENYACGMNFPDTLIATGKYQFKPPIPFSCGCEISGIVSKVNRDSKFKVGDRIVAYLTYGGLAEMVPVDEDKMIRIPDSLDFHSASALLVTYGTSLYALKDRAELLAGETILVLGASGGVGLATIQLAKSMGAKVIACASTPEKLELCKAHGADHLINYVSQNLKKEVLEITQGSGVDVVCDPVGDKFAEQCVRLMAWNGRYLVIGFAGGEIPKIPLNLALLKGCSLVGVFWGAHTVREPALHRDNVAALLAHLAAGRIRPHLSRLYALAEGEQALEDLRQRRVQGKAVVTIRE